MKLTLLFSCLFIVTQGIAAENVIISEFMAANTRTLADENGDFEDWIEISNTGTTPVNLGGWYLTDSASDLTRWQFPATNLNAGGFLIVFASSKDRRIPGARLHTNFRLSAGGEYLALVKPDGVTVVSAFAPTYGPQADDVSYGIGVLATNHVVISSNAGVRVLVPSSGALGTTWQNIGFNDSSWTQGTNGVGFGSSNVVQADYSLSVLPTAPVGYWRLNEASGTTAANLGSGANLNGTYTSATIGTAGPRPPLYPGFEADNNAPTFNGSSGFVVVNNSLLSGRNAFTIGGWIKPAVTPGSRIGLFGQNDCVEFGFISGTTIEIWTPGGGSFQIPYSFPLNTWHHIVAVGDGTQMRIYLDGNLAGSGGGATANYGSSGDPFRIGGGGIQDVSGNFFNGQIDEVVLYHRALSANEIRSLFQAGTNIVGASVVPYVKTDVGATMSNVNASAYIRIPFVVDNPTNISLLTLRARYDDGFVAYINGVEVVRANAPETLAYNSAATNAHTAFGVDEFRFGAALQEGTNILAIQGLNQSANDPDFLVHAELSVTRDVATSTTPVYFTTPTPGAPNSGGALVLGPAILEPAHTPSIPLDNDDLLVTARVRPTFNPVTNVTLRYRVMFDAEIPVTMMDDGLHGDGLAGDGIFGATIPASASTNGQMVRWYFSAADSSGNTSRWPTYFNPAGSAEYLGTVVNPGYVTSKIPIVHLFAPTTVLQPGPTTSQIGADSQNGGRVSLYFDGEFYDNVGMELRGNSTAGYNKKSHRMKFNKEHPFRHAGPGGRLRDTSFTADFPDPTYMRQGLSFWLATQLGCPAPFYEPYRLQLNGKFYQLANHNDVLGDELLERLGYDPNGALYKAAGTVQPSQFSTGVFEKKTRTSEGNADYAALAGAIAETLPVGQRHTNVFEMLDLPNVINYMVAARWAHENDDVWANMSLYHDNDGDNLWRIVPFDMNLSWGAIFYEGSTPSVIEGVQATNDIHKAHPLYGSSQALALSSGNYNRMYDAIFSIPQTREMFLRRMRTMLDTYVKPIGTATNSTMLEQMILAKRDLIAEEAVRDRAWWGWPNKGGQCNFDPGINITNGVSQMLSNFVIARRYHFYGKHSITNTALPVGINKAQNAGIPLAQPLDPVILISGFDFNPSSGNQDQEYVCLTNPMPYAVDMSGWKLSGGIDFTFKPGTVMPSNSVMYVSPNVVAFRARTTGPRGGQGLFVQGPYKGQLNAWGETLSITDEIGRVVSTNGFPATPTPAQRYLRITEIMYNPSAVPGNPTDPQLFEYIELKNIGPDPLDLTGVRFTQGVEFSFTGSAVTSLAPGAKVLVVRNQAAFLSRYPSVTAIAGQFAGSLDNKGETLRLEDGAGEKILEFAYNNAWYPITDGYGFSLVHVNENAYWNTWGNKANWRASGNVQGSPAQDDPAPPVLAPIVINEVLSRSVPPATDRIELYNPTPNDVNIGGWFITDDATNAFKFRIPNGTMIPAGGFKVFTEADFNPAPGVPPSFALSSLGDEVYLFSADANTNLTGYIYGHSFAAADAGVSFGRYVTSDAKAHFVAQTANTFDAANAAPVVGPVVISEVMYHPPDLAGNADDTDSEFIELRNITGTDVALLDPGTPTNTWRIRGDADFNFPPNTILPANSYLVVVDFNPTNVARLTAFRDRYGLSPSTPVYGPYQGSLNNSEGQIRLYKPDVPVGAEVPYILVDAVDYNDSAPWPTAADGTGASIQRLNLSGFGNEPGNWVAASPSANAPSAGGTAPSITAQPVNQTGGVGASTTFNVTAAGSAPLSYQWHFNGVSIPGGTNAALMLTDLKPSQAGNYSVTVFNSAGATLSSNATLVVLYAASFYQEPDGFAVHPGTNVTFEAGGTGTQPLTYQWQKDGVDLLNATNATYSIANVQPVHAGNYRVILTNPAGSLPSRVASLVVYTNPVITVNLTNITTRSGSNISWIVVATSSTPITYQWTYNGVPIDDATNSTLLATNVQPGQSGSYAVSLANAYGTSMSATSLLTVLQIPLVVGQPQPVTVLQGQTASFQATAIGSPMPLSFRWRRNGFTVTNMVVSDTNSTFTITNVQPANAGTYTVVVTNIAGFASPGGISAGALLTVLADNDRDGMADSWEVTYGFNTNSTADASVDTDGDTMSNQQEYVAGTDPTNPLSYLKIDSIQNIGGNPGALILSISAISNRTYSVTYRDGVAAGTWTRLGDIDSRTTNRVVTITNQLPVNMSIPNRFYRLETPKLP